MLDLPADTQKYLIQPLSVTPHLTPHLRKVLIKRCISFIKQIDSSNKIAAKDLLSVIQNDTKGSKWPQKGKNKKSQKTKRSYKIIVISFMSKPQKTSRAPPKPKK